MVHTQKTYHFINNVLKKNNYLLHFVYFILFQESVPSMFQERHCIIVKIRCTKNNNI